MYLFISKSKQTNCRNSALKSNNNTICKIKQYILFTPYLVNSEASYFENLALPTQSVFGKLEDNFFN